MKSLLALVPLLLTSSTLANDPAFKMAARMLPMQVACIEGLVTCRDFLSNSQCLDGSAWKRSWGPDASGPFWANRGKKDPRLTRHQLYAQVPRWEAAARRGDLDGIFDPFFTTRGKKPNRDSVRDRRTEDKIILLGASPFLAARGKKSPADQAD